MRGVADAASPSALWSPVPEWREPLPSRELLPDDAQWRLRVLHCHAGHPLRDVFEGGGIASGACDKRVGEIERSAPMGLSSGPK